jgi:hypothetical protein
MATRAAGGPAVRLPRRAFEEVLQMEIRPGDRVTAESESTNRAPRHGRVEEVLASAGSRPRVRIHWDDGRESILTPADGSLKRDESQQAPGP